MTPTLPSLDQLAEQLRCGQTTSVALTERALACATDGSGEGARVFTWIDAARARQQAQAADLLRAAGTDLGPLMGLPISVKDLFDVKGEVTRAGSVVLAQRAAATHDAVIIERLRRAGAVLIGRTNMVEFAYSGLGLNPHYGTPKNPWDRQRGRIPGGSSSGAAVSVTDRMACAAVGTDTGGSVRIPAALCGLVGFKPTARRVPVKGTLPLSFTLDSIGPLAPSVACCRHLDAVLADQPLDAVPLPKPQQVRLRIPTNHLLERMDDAVAAAFERALAKLSAAGIEIVAAPLPAIDRLFDAPMAISSVSPAEAYAWHRALLDEHREQYDPRVAARLLRGAAISAADYLQLLDQRRALIDEMALALAGFDALVVPTVVVIAPAIAPLEADDELYRDTNALVLRNTSLINFMDGCALSLPIQAPGAAPVGLMLAQCSGQDAQLLALGACIEGLLGRPGLSL